jgi:CBS domain-containing protein
MASHRVVDVMTKQVVYLPAATPLDEAARAMREADIGDVVVTEGPNLAGMVTDRDIVVRAVAEGRAAESTPVREVATGDVRALQPSQSVDEAIQAMREHDIRRLPVVDGGRPVGIVSLGDLAVERDPDSALADISAAAPDQ